MRRQLAALRDLKELLLQAVKLIRLETVDSQSYSSFIAHFVRRVLFNFSISSMVTFGSRLPATP
jgi:hypothetical protein